MLIAGKLGVAEKLEQRYTAVTRSSHVCNDNV